MARIELDSFLSEITQENTKSYRDDLSYDLDKLYIAAREPKMEDRSFYWMSRPHGTWCVKERDVFLRDSHAHRIWTYYGEDAEHIRAYRIVVAKAGENDTHTYGEVYPINYAEQIPRIQKAALPVDRVEIHFTDDKIETVSYSTWIQKRWEIERGTPALKYIRFLPESESELTAAIMLEHRHQRSKVKKPPIRTAKSPVR